MKLDVGCGGRGTILDGFIGVDLYPPPENPRRPAEKYIQMDFLHDPLPWPAGSVDEIVCFHVIEHMGRPSGVLLLRRIYSLLKPGASAYIKCPDTKLFASKYLEGDKEFFHRVYPKNGRRMWPGLTLLESFFYSMHDERSYGHRKPYDLDTLLSVAAEAGCKDYRPLPAGHFWAVNAARDHECGIIITKK